MSQASNPIKEDGSWAAEEGGGEASDRQEAGGRQTAGMEVVGPAEGDPELRPPHRSYTLSPQSLPSRAFPHT